MLNTNQILLGLALSAALFAGCGSDEGTEGNGGSGGGTKTTSSSTTTTTSESTTTTTTTSDTGAGGGLTCTMGEGPVLAVSELSFGEGDSGEWKSVGFNLDGLVSTAVSKDVCQPNSGAFAGSTYPDGDQGIDNSFGKNLLPLILSLYPTWVTDINDGIDNGYFTSLLKMECLPPTGDVPVFTAKLYGGKTLGSKPKFDGTDKWPVAPELLSDLADPLSSTVIFAKSSVVGSEFDSGKNETFILTVPLKSKDITTSLKLTLYAAQIKMTLGPDRKSSTKGIIGGVLNTEEFVAEVKKIGVLLDLCDTQVFNNILDEVRRASDILSDGTQDTSKTCDGISIGLGFEMKEGLIGDVGPTTPVGMSCN